MNDTQPGEERAAATAATAEPRRRRIISRLAPITVTLALASAFATFLVLAGFSPIVPKSAVVLDLFLANAIIILVLLALIAFEGFNLIAARRAGAAGARLHIRIVALFSVVAAVPALIIAIVASITLERGLTPAFLQDVRGYILRTADAVKSYRETQCETLLREANLTASDLDRSKPIFASDRTMFHDYLASRARFLGFTTTAMIKRDGEIVERVDAATPLRVVQPEPTDFDDAQRREPVCLELEQGRTFVALRVLPAFEDVFLYIARRVAPFASADLSDSAANLVALYDLFDEQRRHIEIAFATMYVLLALIMLLSAVWLGLSVANRLVAPIRRLIHATDQVSSGNLYVQVPIKRTDGDLASLGTTFNKMTAELRIQQNRLITTNALLDERRMFTEAVLSGVPAAVIGVDSQGRISVLNPSAAKLVGVGEGEPRDGVIDAPLVSVIPELAPLIDQARAGRARVLPGQITLVRAGRDRIFNVRLTAAAGTGQQGYVITLDDITDLIFAQRTTAWADVARRIAHEIKNPLTPIQLSAERLKRKYGRLITEDREVFDQCTETIIRQVDDIKRMVDEFSSFARMPKAMLERDDLGECVRQVMFLMRVGHPEIAFEEHLPDHPVVARFDRRLLSRALTNIIKNATEGIAARQDLPRGKGRIVIDLQRSSDGIVSIDVIDNGIGFPAENRQRLLEPYMTTRSEGTGLGLAIVAKILEDHGGGIELLDAPADEGDTGARIRLHFPAGDDTPGLPEPAAPKASQATEPTM
ncbi:MAG: PAS domain-containing sensor histidine kinase [Methylobacteriaceae bacterium]|nr:PAS domain-containing sensor histidine kinase [Methylobacteriaceae bacterium]